MSFEQQNNSDSSERQNIGDQQQSNPQLNFVDIVGENGGSLSNLAKGSQSADAYLPNLSIGGTSGEAAGGGHSFDWAGNNGSGFRSNDSSSEGRSFDWAGNNGNNGNDIRNWQGGLTGDSGIPTAQSFQGIQSG